MEKKKEKVELNPFKSDVFSLGLVILELGILQLPSRDEKPNKWRENIKTGLKIFKKKYKKTLNTPKDKKTFRIFMKNLKSCLALDENERPDFKKLFIRLLKEDDEILRNHILLQESDLKKILEVKNEKNIENNKESPNILDVVTKIPKNVLSTAYEMFFNMIKSEELKIDDPDKQMKINNSEILEQKKRLEMYNKKKINSNTVSSIHPSKVKAYSPQFKKAHSQSKFEETPEKIEQDIG